MILLRWLNQGQWDGGTWEMHIKYLSETLKREHDNNIDIDGMIILKLILNKLGVLCDLDTSSWA